MTILGLPLGARADFPSALCLHSEESEGFTVPRSHLISVAGFPDICILGARRSSKRGEAISLISLDNMGKLGYKLGIEGRNLIHREEWMHFPQLRLRRLRKNDRIRRLVRETCLRVDDFVYPLFVCPGKDVKNPISSMVGQFQLSIDHVIEEVEEAEALGIPGVILFGIPERKDEMGTEAYSDDGIIQRAVRAIKEELPDFLVITDVCLCEYTSHGHCGVIEGDQVLNDPTLELLAKQALSHARAGADMVAPSDMMDGRVGAIRKVLDENGYSEIPIMAYSAKFSSSYYGPFREAAESTPQFGDRKSYQMDFANADEALREVRLDIQEGADIVMVKPALPYLDIIRRVKEEFQIPVAAFNVSGEYAMIKAAAQLGWIDGERAMMESLLSIKRAGADIIVTYFAKEAAKRI